MREEDKRVLQTSVIRTCRRCGQALTGTDPQPLRHQVWELPDIKPHVTVILAEMMA